MNQRSIPRRDFLAGLATPGAAGPLAQDGTGPKRVPRKTLGTTGVTVPIILMGGSTTFDMQYDKRLHRAFQLGVDYIDTAQIYAAGQSQKTIAPFLAQAGREKVWVTSKVKLVGSRATPENYKRGLDKCLEDLETDYLDMFFLHMIERLEDLDAPFIKMGEELKKAGKTRLFGFSCHHGNVPEMMSKAATIGSAGIDAIMFRYNFRQYGDVALNRAIDACKEAGIGLIAMKTQGSVPPELEKVVEFQSRNFTLPQAKLKAVWADDRIDAAVSGMNNVEEIMENTAAAMSEEQLAMSEFVQLKRLAALSAAWHCLGCGQRCEPHAPGCLRIADTLRYLMYHECYGEAEEAKSLYAALAEQERDFEGVDLGAAEAACPQGIPIRERLALAKQLLSS